jgi:hypothetical protein
MEPKTHQNLPKNDAKANSKNNASQHWGFHTFGEDLGLILEPKSFQNHPREAPSPKTKSLVKPLYLLCFFKIRPSKKQQKGGKFSQKSHCENDRHKSKKKTVFLTKCDHQNHPKSSTNAPKTLSKTTPEKNEKTIQKGHAGAAHRRLNPPNTRVNMT